MTAVATGLFWRLLIASLVMLIAGYLGEVNAGNATAPGLFIIGMAGWLHHLRVFAGEASRINVSEGTVAGQKAFNALRMIVTVGWLFIRSVISTGTPVVATLPPSTSSTTG